MRVGWRELEGYSVGEIKEIECFKRMFNFVKCNIDLGR